MHPFFRLKPLVKVKSDTKHETINEVVLKDAILELFQQVKPDSFDPLRSILILRDGRKYGRELESIASATKELIKEGLLEKDARIDTVDFHKRSVKRIRMWFRTREGQILNVREGTACIIDAKTVVLANTGVATLSQGTVNPVMLVAHRDGVSISSVAQDVHSATHLNWSNPRVAQRLPIELKRTDEELTKRADQEIRRMR
jgi:argonaute-like protein implicated in RNA metabolism and viral defense